MMKLIAFLIIACAAIWIARITLSARSFRIRDNAEDKRVEPTGPLDKLPPRD